MHTSKEAIHSSSILCFPLAITVASLICANHASKEEAPPPESSTRAQSNSPVVPAPADAAAPAMMSWSVLR
eukprot:770368-Amphidinium_carterae.1